MRRPSILLALLFLLGPLAADPGAGLEQARANRLELQERVRRLELQAGQMASRLELAGKERRWYDVGSRLRRDQLLRRLRQEGHRLRELRPALQTAWRREIREAQPLRERRLEGGLEGEALELLKAHDRERLEHWLDGEAEAPNRAALDAERRYYKALRTLDGADSEASRALERLETALAAHRP